MYKNYTRIFCTPNGYVHKLIIIVNSGLPRISDADKKKWIMRANLTAFIILLTLMQVSAATFGQNLTLKEKNISYSKLFFELRKQTGFNVLVKSTEFNTSKRLDADFKNASIDMVMKEIVMGKDLDYEIEEKTVFIKEKKKSIIDKVVDYFSNIDVTGRLVDESGQPISGATIKVRGTTMSTSSNAEGIFSFKGIDEMAILEISYVGFQPKELKAEKDLGNIKMAIAIGKLEEVTVNAGYYTVRERERTGSISKITYKDIEKQPVSNVLAAMQVNIPGVQVIQTTGVPGGGFNVQIRGRNSISQGNNPFYIIDGVPFTAELIVPINVGQSIIPSPSPLATINPADIESVEVLKDADATAIYGSRGANGVVLITTKKGKLGKTRINVNVNQGISRVGSKLDLMNTEQYLEMRKEAYFTNDKLTTASSQYATQYDINGAWDQNKYTDWQKELIGGNAPVTNIQTSLSGGTGNIQYHVGGSYYNEGTVFPGSFSFSRNTGNMGFQYSSDNKKFNAMFSANYSVSESNMFNEDILGLIFLPPNFPNLVNPDGSLNWENNTMGSNPIANTRNPFKMKTNNLVANAVLGYEIIPSVQLSSSFGYTSMFVKNFNARLLSTINPTSTQQRSASFGNNSLNTWIVEPKLNWSKQYGQGKLELLLGTTFQESLTEGQNLNGTGYTSDKLLENLASASTITTTSTQYLKYRYTAVYGRVNFNYNEKYILNATARRDGSTRFGNEKRFANFGAIGAAWIISNESFIKDIQFINFAKLRGSYGITGNDQIGDYAYLPLWGNNPSASATYLGLTTIKPDGLANPDYAWEINKKLELALEFSVLNNRINFGTNFYSNRSSNQLVSKQLAPSIGFTSIRDNLPAVVSNTGWEFLLNSKNITSKDFQWTTSFNLTIPKNKLVSYPNIKSSGNDAFTYEVGHPLTIKRLYNTYLDTNTGLYVREDYDGNNVFNTNDLYLIKFIGRKYYGGIQNTFSYKGLELDFLLQVVGQNGLSHFNGGSVNAPGNFPTNHRSNQLVEVLNRWQNPGDNTAFQKFSTTSTASTAYLLNVSSGALNNEDASFIRMKNISVSYHFPKKLIQKAKIEGLKVYLQGQNIFTITKYKGLDPEVQSTTLLPSLQVFSAGLQFTL